MSNIPQHDVSPLTRQSPPLDLSSPLKTDPAFIQGKTIVITGGASGLGAGFSRQWASHGANVIIGDINVKAGEELVAQLRSTTKSSHHHFVPLDVTSWESQVHFFREAVRLSPHRGIDTVVANAGINNAKDSSRYESPTADYETDLDPPAPMFRTMDVNLVGVLYTAHLALFYLPRNPGSKPCSATSPPRPGERDRHLILLGSMASFYPAVTQVPYTVSKHGVLALFRCLRMTAPITAGVRVNMITAYFIDTPLLTAPARLVVAGCGVGCVDDVVQAATWFLSKPDILGRALFVGPKVKVRVPINEDGFYLGGVDGIPSIENVFEVVDPSCDGKTDSDGVIQDRSIWEVYAHDFEQTDLFTWRMVTLINAATAAKGWFEYITAIVSALTLNLSWLWYRKARKAGKSGTVRGQNSASPVAPSPPRP